MFLFFQSLRTSYDYVVNKVEPYFNILKQILPEIGNLFCKWLGARLHLCGYMYVWFKSTRMITKILWLELTL